VTVRTPSFREIAESSRKPVLLFLICSKRGKRGIVHLGSIPLVYPMPSERWIHDHQIEVLMGDAKNKVSDLLRTSSSRRLSNCLNDVECWLFLE
jgi:hypothetical protein